MPLELDVKLGEPTTRGALALFRLIAATGDEAPTYLPGPDAVRRGLLDVNEQDEMAVVTELTVHNRADVPVVLIEGETLVGVKQNRVLNVSVLLEPATKTTIPVSCVEAGRWGTSTATGHSMSHTPTQLRARKTESVNRSMRSDDVRLSDQAAVWSAVEDYADQFGTASPTAALEDVHVAAAGEVGGLIDGLKPVADQVGVVVALGGEPSVLELFDHPATLASYWDGLLRGYALDAVVLESTSAVTTSDAAVFIDQVRAGKVSRSGAVGLGVELQLEGPDITGTGLEWEGRRPHLAAFALGSDRGEGRTSQGVRSRPRF